MKATKILKTLKHAWVVQCEDDDCENKILVPKRPGVIEPDARYCVTCGAKKFTVKK